MPAKKSTKAPASFKPGDLIWAAVKGYPRCTTAPCSDTQTGDAECDVRLALRRIWRQHMQTHERVLTYRPHAAT